METTMMGYIGTTVRIHSFIPSQQKVRLTLLGSLDSTLITIRHDYCKSCIHYKIMSLSAYATLETTPKPML